MDEILYFNYLNKLKDSQPDVYLKLMDYPDSTLIGIINDMMTSRLNLDDDLEIKKFFSTRPHLTKMLEIL